MNYYCSYYQATVLKSEMWYLVAILRSFEHIGFDRTLNKQTNRFEFFVPQDLESFFIEVMNYFQQELIVTDLQKLPNRLCNSQEIV